MTDIKTSAPAGRLAHPTRPRTPLPVLMAGTFVLVLDFFIVNVALPRSCRLPVPSPAPAG